MACALQLRAVVDVVRGREPARPLDAVGKFLHPILVAPGLVQIGLGGVRLFVNRYRAVVELLALNREVPPTHSLSSLIGRGRRAASTVPEWDRCLAPPFGRAVVLQNGSRSHDPRRPVPD